MLKPGQCGLSFYPGQSWGEILQHGRLVLFVGRHRSTAGVKLLRGSSILVHTGIGACTLGILVTLFTGVIGRAFQHSVGDGFSPALIERLTLLSCGCWQVGGTVIIPDRSTEYQKVRLSIVDFRWLILCVPVLY